MVQQARLKLSFLIFLSSFQLFSFASALILGQALSVEARDSESCADPNFTQCGNKDLTSSFCCPQSSTCIARDDGSTVICCPKGEDCSTIKPITCDVQEQNAKSNPKSTIKTTKFDKDLPKCGDVCCPHGYACENNSCVVDKRSSTTTPSTTSTSIAPSTSTSTTTTSTSTSISTSTPSTNTASATTSSALHETTSPLTAHCPPFPAAAVAVGFFPGLLCGVLITLAWFLWRRRQADRPNSMSSSSALGQFRHRSDDGMVVSISDPIPCDAQDSARTDFLRHQPDYHQHDNPRSRIQRTSDRVKSFFVPRSPTDPGPPMVSVTPPNQIYTGPQQGTESITVVSAAPNGHGDARLNPIINITDSRPHTTFSEMMDRVGFQNGRGSPCYPVTDTPQMPSRYYAGSPLRHG